VLSMLELLQAHHRLGGRDLAERLGVDERTVRRYATTLADLGIPVAAERGRYGGYRLAPGYKLPPLMLTDDEAVAVVLGLLAAERLNLSTAAPATAAAFAKILRVLPTSLAARLAAIQEILGWTLTRRDGSGARPEADVLLRLAELVQRRMRASFQYQRNDGEQARREVDPYGLVFHSGRWYLTGHDHGRDEVRTYRVDRITEVSNRSEQFEIPAGFDAVAHVTAGLARVPYRWRVEVFLETDLAQARRRIPATVAELREEAGGVTLTARAERLDGMARMLAGLEWPFTVVRPAELRTALAAHAADLARLAQRAGRPDR
jgi:predicted DNA-binding transcriptional regulator YafY